MNSIWSDEVSLPHFPKLEGDVRTDVLIVGGGVAGILCAYFLQEAGVKYVLLEKDTIAGGVTRYTTAKITAQQGLCYRKLYRRLGKEKTAMYLQANEDALSWYKKLAWQYEFGFEEQDSYVFTRKENPALEQELKVLGELQYPAEYVTDLPLPFSTAGAVRLPHQGQMNPYQLIAQLAEGLHIYEHSEVREMTEYFAVTKSGTVTAEKIIVATHFPFINTRGSYYLKLYQNRAYVLALEQAQDVNGIYLEEGGDGLSLRNAGDYLLVGGSAKRTGKLSEGWKTLRTFAKEYYPNAREKYHWATQDCMSLDGMPYIGTYSRWTPDLYVASGFSKWGMTGAMLSARILTDLVQGEQNEYAALFSPSRNMLSRQLFCNLKEAISSMLPPGKKRCTHLGCVLQWNAVERTWDCPCHGSRFEEDGSRIENPACDDLKKQRKKKEVSQ